jgi:hypothetical protein
MQHGNSVAETLTWWADRNQTLNQGLSSPPGLCDGPNVQADRARDDFHARPVTGPGVQVDRAQDDFHARHVTGPGVQTDWPGKE